MKKMLIPWILPAAVLLVWWCAAEFAPVPRAILPLPQDVFILFVNTMKDGSLVKDLSVSLIRVLKAYSLATVCGLVTGSLMGIFPDAERMISPMLTAVRQIPVIAWIPLLILWFGIGEGSKIAVIFIASFFPITVNTLDGMLAVPREYMEVASMYRYSMLRTYLTVQFPSAFPRILTGMRLGLGSAWMAVVAAELIAASSGIGYRLNYARGLMESDLVILCMLVIGFVGFLLDLLLRSVSRLVP